ncbi:hypothetical protein C6I21_07170 [Alkalicoccus urumqiensis]|uniref:Uncharacterized protein n=1 Tax=Alkalicoccus urumqiensis TaxID=1548213 RepID=A0A2P6MIF1_ALKUR|nr:hypothetical protein C6I21_07170 [Alkalicoccus urumqiensis]
MDNFGIQSPPETKVKSRGTAWKHMSTGFRQPVAQDFRCGGSTSVKIATPAEKIAIRTPKTATIGADRHAGAEYRHTRGGHRNRKRKLRHTKRRDRNETHQSPQAELPGPPSAGAGNG